MSKEYRKVARDMKLLYLFGRWAVSLFPTDPGGKIYKLLVLVPLDGWTTDPNKIIESLANDPAFSISYADPEDATSLTDDSKR